MRDWTIYERVDPSNASTYYLYRIHLDRYLSHVALAKRRIVLDVGCAYGFGSAALGNQADRVVGIDSAPEVVREAKNRYDSGNIDFVVMSAEHLGFKDQSIEGAYAFEVVEHLAHPDSFFNDVERILRKSGFLILSTPNKLGSKDENPFHITEYSLEELDQILQKHFSRVNITGMSHSLLFERMMGIRRLLPSRLVELVKGNRPFESLIDLIAKQNKKSEAQLSSGLLAVCLDPWGAIEENRNSLSDLFESNADRFWLRQQDP